MPRKRYTPEQIIRHLRQAEVLCSQHRSVSEICREIGVSERITDGERNMGVWEWIRRLKEQLQALHWTI